MTEASAKRMQMQARIMECLNRFHAIETDMWGPPLDALIIRTVIAGKLEGRCYDLSAIAATLGLPLSTIHRKVAELEAAGFLRRSRKGRSMFLIPTERTCAQMEQSFGEMVATIERLNRSQTTTPTGMPQTRIS